MACCTAKLRIHWSTLTMELKFATTVAGSGLMVGLDAGLMASTMAKISE